MSKTATKLASLDTKLVAKNFPALSPFWKATLESFLCSDARQLVLRVGRRGGKSSSLCRLGVAFALGYDVKQIPPGDVGVVAFISVNRDEASQRLRTIKAILDALGTSYRPVDGGIELVGLPIVFKVFSATVGGVSGFTSILIVCDEVAKWRNSDASANPAEEVLASVRPTLASQPQSRIILSSSAMGCGDAHAEAFDVGDDDFQTVAFAESWIANPTITESATRKLEKDPATWAREYACIPQVGGANALDVDSLKSCVRRVDLHELLAAPEVVIDTSGGKHDSFVISVFAWISEPGFTVQIDAATGAQIPIVGPLPPRIPRLCLVYLEALEGDIAKLMTTGDVADKIRNIAGYYGATRVHGDQYGAWSWSSELSKRGLVFEEHPWTAPSKADAVQRLRTLIRDDQLVILDRGSDLEVAALIREGASFQQIILPSGGLSFRGRGSSKDDRIMTLLLAARVDAEGRLRGSPLNNGRSKHTIYDNDQEALESAIDENSL